MTYEQETKEISAFLRSNCGCLSPSGILTNAADRLDDQAEQIRLQSNSIAWLKNVINLQNQDIEIRKGWHEQQNQQIEELRKLIADIKAWDVDQFITLPLALRKRMQAVLDNAEQTGQ